ncbi:MAG: tRNA (N(6)-L-threonylcarbamoyladenosine(37)-C(2))-methylthiotransferase MtaB, partial [Clostridia bacterium]|nr:tRNA (N(6)-L-threonylcarbamoyladenosine(37)-C(2))-methylthiotransferase MtaB [Clostridia bacterium]
MNKTVGILTLGCKVNQYESEAIGESLASHGFLLCPPSDVCDIYIINTCTVTAESDRKARQFIRRALSHNPDAFVLVTGCMAQTDAESIRQIEGVDFICGNRNKMAIVNATLALWARGKKNDAPEIDVPSLDGADFEHMSICRFGRTRAYIKIEDGCESRCTYCIIPAARGHIRSKPMETVLDEVRTLTEGGCREVVLTGIETASWGRDLDGADLADLLEAVDRVPGIGRVRLGSLDPTIMRPAFVERIAKLSSLAPHFHLSMQSGSDAVLARMKRKYNSKQALSAIERLRAAMPNVQLTTDIIVGFPGETEEEFEETLRFSETIGFARMHVFPFSPRETTPAAVMPDQIPE